MESYDRDMIESPGGMNLEEFKHQVKLWMEIDNQIKSATAIVKDKKKVQSVLTEKILAFMTRYNIEDLNTRDGKLRYKVTRLKPSVRQKQIKDRIGDCFKDDPETAERVMKEVFDTNTESAVVRTTLCRLKASQSLNV
jgi:hypothetical protein